MKDYLKLLAIPLSIISIDVSAQQYLCKADLSTVVLHRGYQAEMESNTTFIVDLNTGKFKESSEAEYKGSCEGYPNYMGSVTCTYIPAGGGTTPAIELLAMEGLPSLRFVHFTRMPAGSLVRNGSCSEI